MVKKGRGTKREAIAEVKIFFFFIYKTEPQKTKGRIFIKPE